MEETQLRIVVGVDGSEDARVAADWAVRGALAHRAPLLVIHAWSLPAVTGGVDAWYERTEEAARQLLDDEVEHLQALAPGLDIESQLRYGSPIEVLLELAHDPNLIVVGSRGIGRVSGLLLGSVSQAVVTRAACPVLVIPPAGGKES